MFRRLIGMFLLAGFGFMLLVSAVPAHAAGFSLTFNITANLPLFQRPTMVLCGGTGVQPGQSYYQTTTFTVPESADYSYVSNRFGTRGYIYTTFDAGNPEAGLVARGGSSDSCIVHLDAGVTYTYVATWRDPGQTGEFSVNFSTLEFSLPPEVPLCSDQNFSEPSPVRVSIPDRFRSDINCRVMYINGQPARWLWWDLYGPGNIGIEGVLNLGVEQAIDIFSPSGLTYWEGGAVFCLRGQGPLVWMAASGTPRHAEIIGSYTVPDFPGFTCATLFEPGTLVLVNDFPDGPSATATPAP
ncbi:MAG: hypothetical protein U0452_04800 [Anaerolineae bacterium]